MLDHLRPQNEEQDDEQFADIQEKSTVKGGSKLFGMISDRETNREAESSAHHYPIENQRTSKPKRTLREAFGSNTSPTKLDLLPNKQSSLDKAANTDDECEEGEVVKAKPTYAKSTQDQEHDMTKKVVVYLEKMRERNSSL